MEFNFKEFSINQEKSAMKVGTDGVLLGAWVSIKENPYSILDIGAGTGLISLQLAQRCDAELIDAIEIENDAFEQTVENFEKSNWSDRLFCYHASLAEFVDEIDDKYDLIVSNPPFYTGNYNSINEKRNTARLVNSLPFEELLTSVSTLLEKKGIFSVIIPFKEEDSFINIAKKHKLFPKRICRVKGNNSSLIKRSLMEFSFQNNEVLETSLTIELERHQYTEEYKNLVKDFYLKM